MRKTLADLVVVSDVDGTLLNAPAPIPGRNIKALQRFTQKGGHFTIATGRAVESAREYVNQLPVNIPCILYNGCGVYDYRSETLLYGTYLPVHWRSYLKIIQGRFPEIGAALFDLNRFYSITDPRYTTLYLSQEHMRMEYSTIDAIEGQFFKVVMAMPPEAIPLVESFVQQQGWTDVSFVRSAECFLEMLPVGAEKGSGLQHLAQVLNIDLGNICAIGDYYNDLTMLHTAGFPVTVEGAPDDIKEICHLVTGPCNDGAVADLIEYLETTYT